VEVRLHRHSHIVQHASLGGRRTHSYHFVLVKLLLPPSLWARARSGDVRDRSEAVNPRGGGAVIKTGNTCTIHRSLARGSGESLISFEMSLHQVSENSSSPRAFANTQNKQGGCRRERGRGRAGKYAPGGGDNGKEGERRKTRKMSEFGHNADACRFEAGPSSW
jgi:hypothetical protein